MSEKLELKHLAPYLPHKLKVNIGEYSESNVDLTCGHIYNYELYSIKPILRPLSDLTKITSEHLTNHDLNMLIGENNGYGKITIDFYDEELELTYESDSDQQYDSSKSISFYLFEKVRQELLKNHFDVFGLIKKGLAVDINTLNK